MEVIGISRGFRPLDDDKGFRAFDDGGESTSLYISHMNIN
jgi:hypothetical protein